ncbi:hypothetical protein V6N13_128912 [Hibiscus sabdariffa]|uniref:Uncharacterized protein n=1 Tax=Hibiscus sabdariffa TaxID=183260 RepID=A0ABR2SJK1_9ROSI
MGGGKDFLLCDKGIPYPGLPKRVKPRRVELYFSSWIIRPGESVSLPFDSRHLHYEDMGIPKDMATLGVRHRMWGAVKKLHYGMRAYQNARKTVTSLSRCALMARIATKIHCDENTTSAGIIQKNMISSLI